MNGRSAWPPSLGASRKTELGCIVGDARLDSIGEAKRNGPSQDRRMHAGFEEAL
jgi:hypothetical protein